MVAGAVLAVAVTALLVSAPLAARVRQIRCDCTVGCSDPESGICVTKYQCFTHYMHGDVNPIAYGCLRRRSNSLLCEKWVHIVGRTARNLTSSSSSVVCCDTDLCNRRSPPTAIPAPPLDNSTQIPQDILSQIISEAKTTVTPTFSSKLYPLDKPVVLCALFVGLFFLLAILTFGFYLLHKQSRIVKRLWKNRSQGEMTLSLMDVTPSTC